MKWKKRILGICLCMCICSCLLACGNNMDRTKIVLTTGFGKNEVFRIEGVSCTVPEIMVYITNLQNQYEEVYGAEIWNTSLEGVTLEENIKDNALARIAQIKTLNLMATDHAVTLTDEEKALATGAATEYYNSLNEAELKGLAVSAETITKMYDEYALAQKVYQFIIKDINPEISDDEARTITVEHILIKTYTTDGAGNMVPYTESAKADAYERIQEVYTLATNGEHSFEELIGQFNEDSVSTYSFGKGDMDINFENAAFNLGTDEISGIVETPQGYDIIKCLNTFNREETDSNKLKIMEERKEEVFGQEYDAFVDSLTRNLNEDLWKDITLLRDESIVTSDFFDIYQKYFEIQ